MSSAIFENRPLDLDNALGCPCFLVLRVETIIHLCFWLMEHCSGRKVAALELQRSHEAPLKKLQYG